jgi:hypothetical protein
MGEEREKYFAEIHKEEKGKKERMIGRKKHRRKMGEEREKYRAEIHKEEK